VIIELRLPDSIKLDLQSIVDLQAFLQQVINRYCVGSLRYGDPAKRKRYQTRLAKEFRAYRRIGNAEQLFNIALYCFLEHQAPENRKFHFDASVDSVTRGEMGL